MRHGRGESAAGGSAGESQEATAAPSPTFADIDEREQGKIQRQLTEIYFGFHELQRADTDAA